MATVQQIKKRISNISSTEQITRSMRMVSSAKVVKARSRWEKNNLFVQHTQELMHAVLGSPDVENHPYVKPKPNGVTALIVITADRGLCGGYNGNACKLAHELLRASACRIITIGAKARDYMLRRQIDTLEKSYTGLSESPFFEDAI